MHRFYLPPEQCTGTKLALTGSEAHHALNVLRIRANESVSVLDGAGRELSCAVVETTRHSVVLAVKSAAAAAPLPFSITLVQAVPKGKIIESIIQKATELGVARVIPLLSERVVTSLDAESASAKAAKWQQAAVEAIKQCGNAWLPKIEEPVTPAALLARGEAWDLFLVGSLRDGSRHPRHHLDAYVRRCGHPPQTVCVWVGPEGDFSAAEYDAAEAAGALPITLGRLVLRSETAATYCMSVLSYEMQWLAGQK